MSLEQPNSISFKDHIFDFSFHPSRNVIAVGLITGQIQWYELKRLRNIMTHTTTALSIP